MARPQKKLPPATTHRITIRLTDEMYEVVTHDAEAAQLSIAEYIRHLILNRKIRYHPPIIHADTAIVHELHDINKLGNNLNQIARYLNQDGTMTNPLAKELRETLRQINDSCSKLNHALEEEYGRH